MFRTHGLSKYRVSPSVSKFFFFFSVKTLDLDVLDLRVKEKDWSERGFIKIKYLSRQLSPRDHILSSEYLNLDQPLTFA